MTPPHKPGGTPGNGSVGVDPGGVSLDVVPDDLLSAGQVFSRVEAAMSSAASVLAQALPGSGGMAGSDSGAQKWADKYDPVATDPQHGPLAATTDLRNGAAMMRDLLAYSAANHHNADNPGAPVPAPGTTPQHTAPSVPKAFGGGAGGEPGWWTFIAKYTEGFLWPNGDPAKLRAVAEAYRKAAGFVREAAGHIPPAVGLIEQQAAPEVPSAARWCSILQDRMGDVAAQLDVLATACGNYAYQIEEAHKQIEEAAKDLAWQSAAIEVVGGVAAFFTAGISELIAQGGEASRLVAVGARIANICRSFATLAEASGAPVLSAVGGLARTAVEMKPLLDARAVLYTATAGEQAEAVEVAAARAESLTVEEFETKYGKPGAWKYPEETDPGKPYAVPGTKRDISPAEWKAELGGKNVDRYGRPNGGWLAPEGTPFEARAMPPGSGGGPLTSYKVGDGPLPPGYRIEKSEIAPWFGQPGGGVQYRIVKTVTNNEGKLVDATQNLDDLIAAKILVPAD
ncbi:TNT domain-containing protein [Segniliparus rotundus]|uniref:TNT domain-containing protein n=1 Tax=Segniliparus rotundus TaxID=286802 RepID=UPI0002E92F6A|nr:TNT domain-containing protein [Segniliparus rotundus]